MKTYFACCEFGFCTVANGHVTNSPPPFISLMYSLFSIHPLWNTVIAFHQRWLQTKGTFRGRYFSIPRPAGCKFHSIFFARWHSNHWNLLRGPGRLRGWYPFLLNITTRFRLRPFPPQVDSVKEILKKL